MAPSRYTIAAAAGAALLAAAPARAAPTTIGVTLNFKARAHTVATPFLAFNIDTGSIYNGFDFTEPKLIALIAQLGPTILRIGGTAADYAYYPRCNHADRRRHAHDHQQSRAGRHCRARD